MFFGPASSIIVCKHFLMIFTIYLFSLKILFRRDYLNIMDGWCLEREENNIKINNNGKDLLNTIRSPLFSRLVGEEYSGDIEELIAELKERDVTRWKNDKL